MRRTGDTTIGLTDGDERRTETHRVRREIECVHTVAHDCGATPAQVVAGTRQPAVTRIDVRAIDHDRIGDTEPAKDGGRLAYPWIVALGKNDPRVATGGS